MYISSNDIFINYLMRVYPEQYAKMNSENEAELIKILDKKALLTSDKSEINQNPRISWALHYSHPYFRMMKKSLNFKRCVRYQMRHYKKLYSNGLFELN